MNFGFKGIYMQNQGSCFLTRDKVPVYKQE